MFIQPLQYNSFQGLHNESPRQRSPEEVENMKNDIKNIFLNSVGLSKNTLIYRLYSYIKKDCVAYFKTDVPFEYDYSLVNGIIWENISDLSKNDEILWNTLKDIMFFFNLKLEEQKLIFSYYMYNQGLIKFEGIVLKYYALKYQTCFSNDVESLDKVYKNILGKENFVRLEKEVKAMLA